MRQNDKVLRWLSSPKSQNITGIILEGRWALQLGRMTGSTAEGASLSALAEAISRTLGELHLLGLRVLVLGPVPAMPYPVPECIFRANSEADLRRCRYTSDEVDLAQRNIIDVLRSATMKFDYTRFVDLRPAFCDMAYCWPAQGGNIYYSDTHHLSSSGARILHDRFRDDLAWVFAARQRNTFSSTGPSVQ